MKHAQCEKKGRGGVGEERERRKERGGFLCASFCLRVKEVLEAGGRDAGIGFSLFLSTLSLSFPSLHFRSLSLSLVATLSCQVVRLSLHDGSCDPVP